MKIYYCYLKQFINKDKKQIIGLAIHCPNKSYSHLFLNKVNVKSEYFIDVIDSLKHDLNTRKCKNNDFLFKNTQYLANDFQFTTIKELNNDNQLLIKNKIEQMIDKLNNKSK